MSDPAIAVMPHGLSLGPKQTRLPLDQLIWPLGQPDRLVGGVLGDLARDDHVIVYPKTKLHYIPAFGTKAQISMVMGEPSVIHARHIRLLRYTWRRFFRVLTFHDELLSRLPNARLMPFGTTWVPNWRTLDTTKRRNISLIASAKTGTEGHKLRHQMVARVREAGLNVDIMGRGYTPFEEKSDGLAPYRFSVVIENVREKNYFSEKLVDSVLCDTVPIYWGCPNLDSFVDTSGMIICTSADEVWSAINLATPDIYDARSSALRTIKPAMDRYGQLERRAAEAINAELQGP